MSGDDWQDRANCLGVDPDLFFPALGETAVDAKAVCAGCAVRRECLEEALATPPLEDHGIWGGTSVRQRKAIRAQRTRNRVA